MAPAGRPWFSLPPKSPSAQTRTGVVLMYPARYVMGGRPGDGKMSFLEKIFTLQHEKSFLKSNPLPVSIMIFEKNKALDTFSSPLVRRKKVSIFFPPKKCYQNIAGEHTQLYNTQPS